MKRHENPAIDAAIANLDKVLLTEAEAGRSDVSTWRLYLLSKRHCVTLGAGCSCSKCLDDISESITEEISEARERHSPSRQDGRI